MTAGDDHRPGGRQTRSGTEPAVAGERSPTVGAARPDAVAAFGATRAAEVRCSIAAASAPHIRRDRDRPAPPAVGGAGSDKDSRERSVVGATARLATRTVAGNDTRSQDDVPLCTGTRLGPYRILAPVGSGGMARVYIAAAETRGRAAKLLVVKVMRRPTHSQRDRLEMFLHEAQLAARLSHPNIVQTFEVGQAAGRHFMVMEHLEGVTLGQLFRRAWKRGPLPVAVTVRIVFDVLAALDYAHALTDYDGARLHVIHRDVSPANVFLTYDGRVKLLDFGIAKAATAVARTRTGTLKGTIGYMCPEGVVGEPQDSYSDLYSTGVLLWEGLAGRRMWPPGSSEYDTLSRIARGQIPPLRYVAAHVPAQLAGVCHRALAREPSARFATAAQMRRALEPYVDDERTTQVSRSTARWVAGLFAAERAQARRTLASCLAQTPAADGGELCGAESVELPAPSAAPERTPHSSSRSPSARVVTWLARGGAFALAIAGIAMLSPLLRGSTGGRFTAGQPAPNDAHHLFGADSSSPSLDPAPSVRLVLRAVPAHATLYVNGRALPSNPAALDQDRGSEVTVRVDAPGYVSRERDLVLSRDTEIEVALTKLTRERAATRRRKRARRRRSSVVATPASTPARATPPLDRRRGTRTDPPRLDEDSPWGK